MLKELNKVYLDNVSTTYIDQEVLDTYYKLLKDYYNSDALYDGGVIVYRNQEKSREIIAQLLNAKSDEIIFTSGASESNNQVIKGLSLLHPHGHIITSYYEHSSIISPLKQVSKYLGIEVTYLKPRSDGKIHVEDVINNLKDNTFLVSIMMVNNEIGAINDIKTIGQEVKKRSKAYVHSDMTQALGKLEIDLSNVDLASFSAHKIHGLKGSGILYKKKHIEIESLISAGQQEFYLRGGTSNSPSNIVLAKTIRIALENMRKYHDYVDQIHDYTYKKLKDIPGITIHSFKDGIKGLICFSSSITSEVLINALNSKGIMVSGKSTCGSKENEPSRTYDCMNIDSNHTVRISFDYHNTIQEIDYFIEMLKEILDRYG